MRTHSFGSTLIQRARSRASGFVKFFALALFFFSLISDASAQQRIRGNVTDKETGSPIALAMVKLESDSLASQQLATTDSAGEFSFANLSPGRYKIIASADRFYAEQVVLTLSPRETRQIEFQLAKLATISEQVTVRSEAKMVNESQAATIANLARDQISDLPATRRVNLSDIVTSFVSSAVAGHDNLAHLRGNELSLNTFVNGVSFFDNPHQLFTSGLAPDVIQSVNVITGGFPAEFGNRFGGILDIVTRTGFDADSRGSMNFGLGNYLRDNAAIDYGGHTERLGYFFYAQAFQSDRFLNTPKENIFHDRGRGLRGFAQFDYRADDRDSFTLTLHGGGTNFELPNTEEDELRGRDFFQRNREQTASLSWNHFFSDSSLLSTSVYERYASSRLVPTTDRFSLQAGGFRPLMTLGAKSDYSLFRGSRHALKLGLDLTLLRLRENFFFDPREEESDDEHEEEQGAFDFRGRNTGGQVSLYFQDQLRLTRNFTANLGLRYDQYSLATSGRALSPRINLAYSFSSTVLHFAYNRFFAPPPIENLLLSASLGERPPRIARSNHFEAGIRQAIRNRIVVRLTGFWREDHNAFETSELENVRLFLPTSFKGGKAYGIEFSSRLAEIECLGLSAYFDYTAQRAFFTGPIVGGFAHEELDEGARVSAAFDQIHTVASGLTWHEKRSGFRASAAFEYGSGTPVESERGFIRLPDHFVVNLYFGIDLFRRERNRLSLQLGIENVGDQVYRIAKESEQTPVQFSPPRFVSGSVRFHF
ncbi:MAG: TonB-dependent receptor [Acidobacteriota bacterium]